MNANQTQTTTKETLNNLEGLIPENTTGAITPVVESTDNATPLLLESGDKSNVYQFFGDFSNVIQTAKELDDKIIDVIYFLTDCNSTTVNDYRAFLISEGVGTLKVKREEKEILVSTSEATKKEIYAELIKHIYNDLRGLLSKVNFHSSAVKTASLRDIETILANYEWIIDLRFQLADKPTERLKLIQTINKIWSRDNHTKQLKNADYVHFIATKEYKPVLSKNDILKLNTQTATLGHGLYSTFTAHTLEQHIAKMLKENSSQWKAYFEAQQNEEAEAKLESAKHEGYQQALQELKEKGE